jgi:hypothetical protein
MREKEAASTQLALARQQAAESAAERDRLRARVVALEADAAGSFFLPSAFLVYSRCGSDARRLLDSSQSAASLSATEVAVRADRAEQLTVNRSELQRQQTRAAELSAEVDRLRAQAEQVRALAKIVSENRRAEGCWL